MKKEPTETEKAFVQGAALVCGIVANEFSEETAKYLMDCVGLNREKCKLHDVEEIDMGNLKPVFMLQRKKRT
jgi:hypothetical protein